MSTLLIAVFSATAAVMGISSTASMRGALERGDVDEASRQGMLAGVGVVEPALVASDRTTRLAAITAAPFVEGRAELLATLAQTAAGPDRRVALPAVGAALVIGRELARAQPADDLAPDEIATWRDAFATLALDQTRWIELRVHALDVAVALDAASVLASGTPTMTAGLGVDPKTALADVDPAFRIAVLQSLPLPVPESIRPLVETMATGDKDTAVAKAAAIALCDSPKKCPAARR